MTFDEGLLQDGGHSVSRNMDVMASFFLLFFSLTMSSGKAI
jgi:hypothetical protein